jgi:amino acid permease
MSRRVAGALLWGHVAISFAINCQALCSSIDRFFLLHHSSMTAWDPSKRWLALTFLVSLSSYFVSNAIPFFKDLVALTGALTSIPLTLTLPALLHRKARNLLLLLPGRSCHSSGSYVMFIFSLFFFTIGLIGSLSSINQDWMNQGRPFSCF